MHPDMTMEIIKLSPFSQKLYLKADFQKHVHGVNIRIRLLVDCLDKWALPVLIWKTACSQSKAQSL